MFASSEYAWDPMASSSVNFCRKTRTVPLPLVQPFPVDGGCNPAPPPDTINGWCCNLPATSTTSTNILRTRTLAANTTAPTAAAAAVTAAANAADSVCVTVCTIEEHINVSDAGSTTFRCSVAQMHEMTTVREWTPRNIHRIGSHACVDFKPGNSINHELCHYA
jgi:hypothetical protein